MCGRPLDRWVIYASNARGTATDIFEIYGEFGVYILSELQPTAFSQSNARNHVNPEKTTKMTRSNHPHLSVASPHTYSLVCEAIL